MALVKGSQVVSLDENGQEAHWTVDRIGPKVLAYLEEGLTPPADVYLSTVRLHKANGQAVEADGRDFFQSLDGEPAKYRAIG